MWSYEQNGFKIISNPQALHDRYPTDNLSILSLEKMDKAKAIVRQWPGYQPTPLLKSSSLSDDWRIGGVYYKDESSRFGLKSFKALGGAYALYRVIQRSKVPPAGITAVCATDGNHGRSVAWGAQMFGCRCKIYVHRNVVQERMDAIAEYGAEIDIVDGNYDDAVRRAALDAEKNGWLVVSDTSYPGYTDIPRDVMQGYTVMVDEVDMVLSSDLIIPTHIFLQGGVGGFAAAVSSYYWEKYESDRPTFIIVEPENAACLYSSVIEGRANKIDDSLDTVMAGLSCGEPSILAWQILRHSTDYCMTVPDREVADYMRALATGKMLGQPVIAGESAVAGILGAEKCCTNPTVRHQLEISSNSVILVFGTEGDTAPSLYAKMVGKR